MLTINLSDGTALTLDEAQSPELASANYGTLRGGEYLIARLIVRRYGGDQVVVYVEEQVGAKKKTIGELANAAMGDAGQAARNLTATRELPSDVVDTCLAELAKHLDD